MADHDEIAEAVETARTNGCNEICLLHCTSGYPTPIEEADILTVPELGRRFNSVTGISDHTLGSIVAIIAVSLGASVVEKHVTLSRCRGGFDAEFSIEPHELEELVQDVRNTRKALGTVRKSQKPSELAQRHLRRSLYVIKEMKAGDIFSNENIRSIRPGYGLSPRELPQIIGRRAKQTVSRGTPLSWGLVL